MKSIGVSMGHVGWIRPSVKDLRWSEGRDVIFLRNLKSLSKSRSRTNPLWKTQNSKLKRSGQKRDLTPLASGIFPSGKKQSQIEIPAFVLSITVEEMEQAETLERVNECIQSGITSVLLEEGDRAIPCSAGELYEAAMKLQGVLRDRAGLFVLGRSDIAEAVDAKGVVLTDDSVPLAVARRMLKQKSILLGKKATTPEAVQNAASDGASFVLFPMNFQLDNMEDLERSKTSQRGGRIPVVPVVTSLQNCPPSNVNGFFSVGLDGICIPLSTLPTLGRLCGSPVVNVKSSVVAILQNLVPKATSPSFASRPATTTVKGQRRSLLLTEERERLIANERTLLLSCLEVLQRVSPEIEERSLLEAAVKQLDELFLVVVVGEYNSGKSSVVNALLGSPYLDEGILPTTNEISVLRYSNSEPSVAVQPDGIVERTLPAPLLQEINVVDTPGTNVVLERQQRLTEEYVPRADMVLFVLSCDRPFTESEVRFLEYIRKWGKKIIFVVNKIDLLSGDQDVESVRSFVAQNAQRLLNLTEAQVWPVSARKALEAKLVHGNSSFGGLFPNGASGALELDERWRASRFEDMETFVAEFFSGDGGAASAESLRLKLQTPLYVADALLDASRRQLQNERFAAEKDVAAAKAVTVQLNQFETEMRKDVRVQQQSIRKLLDKVAARAENFVDETLLVSNFFTLRGYLAETTGVSEVSSSKVTKGFTASVLGNALYDLNEALEQQKSWIRKNCDNQLSNYTAFAENCAQQLNQSLDAIVSKEKETDSKETTSGSELSDSELILAALQRKADFTLVLQRAMEREAVATELGERWIENEIRDAVNATGGTALASVGIGLILTVILPSTLEDIIALAISLLIGYAALLNLPLRRGEIKSRIQKLKQNVENEIEKLLDNRLSDALSETISDVQRMIKPLELLFEKELKKVIKSEEERSEIERRLQDVKTQILNIE